MEPFPGTRIEPKSPPWGGGAAEFQLGYGEHGTPFQLGDEEHDVEPSLHVVRYMYKEPKSS